MVLRSLISFSCIAVLTLACNSKGSKSASESSKVEIPDGAALYTENCATCHGIDGTLGKAGSKDLTKTTLQADELKQVIEFGTSNGMPRFKEILGGDEEVEAVIQYIKGFKRINE